MIEYLDIYSKDYPTEKGRFPMSILGPDTVIKKIGKMFPAATIYLKFTTPGEGIIYFNSWRAREFMCNYIEEHFFMTFSVYDFNILPPYSGDIDIVESKTINGKYYRITPRTFDKRRLYERQPI